MALLVMAGLGGPILYGLYFHVASESWRPVPAVVESITGKGNGARMVYGYEVEGRKYVGDRFQYLSAGPAVEAGRIRRYHAGDAVNVLVDPGKASRSVVRRTDSVAGDVMPRVYFMGLAAAVLAGTVWREKRRERDEAW